MAVPVYLVNFMGRRSQNAEPESIRWDVVIPGLGGPLWNDIYREGKTTVAEPGVVFWPSEFSSQILQSTKFLPCS